MRLWYRWSWTKPRSVDASAHERDSYARTCREVRLESVTKIVRDALHAAKGSRMEQPGEPEMRSGCVTMNDDSTVVDNNRHETTW